MLMPAAGTTGVAAQSWETALALRGMALLQPDLPKYLLAPEVAVLLSCFDDERQRMLFAFLWNTGARITEALMVTPEDLQLDGPRPFVRLRTLKQRSRGRGRPARDEKIARVVPLLDGTFTRELRRYLATFRSGPAGARRCLRSRVKRPEPGCSRRWNALTRPVSGLRLSPCRPALCATASPCTCF